MKMTTPLLTACFYANLMLMLLEVSQRRLWLNAAVHFGMIVGIIAISWRTALK